MVFGVQITFDCERGYFVTQGNVETPCAPPSTTGANYLGIKDNLAVTIPFLNKVLRFSVRSNMKAKFIPILDRILLRKRFIIETLIS